MKPRKPGRPQTSAASRAFKQARTQARAARRLAARTAHVVSWWTAMPEPRPGFMASLTLQRALDQPMRRMAAALRWLGWRKIIRRVHGKQVPLWLPPASTINPRPRGRPRIYAPQ